MRVSLVLVVFFTTQIWTLIGELIVDSWTERVREELLLSTPGPDVCCVFATLMRLAHTTDYRLHSYLDI